MPKILNITLSVPSHSRPSSMITWLNKLLQQHRMEVLTVTEDQSPTQVYELATLYPKGTLLIHIKTQVRYRVMYTPDFLRLEANNEPAYAYIRDDDMIPPLSPLWVRGQAEMEDGRFEPVDVGS